MSLFEVWILICPHFATRHWRTFNGMKRVSPLGNIPWITACLNVIPVSYKESPTVSTCEAIWKLHLFHEGADKFETFSAVGPNVDEDCCFPDSLLS